MPQSIILSDEEVRKLKALISRQSVPLSEPKDYEVLRVKSKDILLILYSTNKLVYENTEKTQEILQQIIEKKSSEKLYIGSDETGKGEWYGPLMVVGTCVDAGQISELRRMGIRDSKTISIEKINELARKMIKMKIVFAVREILPERYNELYGKFLSEGKNLNDLLAWAHSEVVKDLLEKVEGNVTEVVIDKFDYFKTDSRLSGFHRTRKVDQSKINVIQKAKGETETPVAAASVLAKYFFEEDVAKLSRKFNVDLKIVSPSQIPKEILGKVAKTNFKNVSKLL